MFCLCRLVQTTKGGQRKALFLPQWRFFLSSSAPVWRRPAAPPSSSSGRWWEWRSPSPSTLTPDLPANLPAVAKLRSRLETTLLAPCTGPCARRAPPGEGGVCVGGLPLHAPAAPPDLPSFLPRRVWSRNPAWRASCPWVNTSRGGSRGCAACARRTPQGSCRPGKWRSC